MYEYFAVLLLEGNRDIGPLQVVLDPLVELVQLLPLKVLGPVSDLSLAEELFGKHLFFLVVPRVFAHISHRVDARALTEGFDLGGNSIRLRNHPKICLENAQKHHPNMNKNGTCQLQKVQKSPTNILCY